MPKTKTHVAQTISLSKQCLAEVFGTFILILLGCGAVHSAVLTGAQSGLWQVAIVWGIAVMLAAYTVGGISGAHINPAMTIALAFWKRFPWGGVIPFIASQLLGAILASAVLFFIYQGMLVEKERVKNVRRGDPGSVITAMCYCEYFPSPGPLAAGDEPYSSERHQQLKSWVTPSMAFVAEVVGTLILAFVVFAVTDPRNSGGPGALAPLFIGLTVAALISIIGPLTQACLNPARDFGPRVFAYLAGWGSAAWPGTQDLGWLTVYIIAPILGALLGSSIYELFIRENFPKPQH